MLDITLAVQPKYQNNEQEIAKFYRELDAIKKEEKYLSGTSRRTFGVYDYDKKNKLVNNTELRRDD